ncbi:MAG: lipopolysaccharide heptosyltransferase II [Pirellulales bacterium]|nr:lipopolysaccharide heptosyltransferase II [Pirellulales bacterium]
MRIALFLPNWLGDLVMATPTIRALRHHFGADAHLVGILRPYLSEVLSGTDWLDEQWFYNPRAEDPALRMLALARRMRQERFDLAVLLPNSLRTALVAWLGGARQRIGYVRNGRGPLLTGRLYPRRVRGRLVDAPVVDVYLALTRSLGCAPESPRLELATVERDERSADAVWRELGLRTDGRVVALNSGSSNGAARFWPAEHFGRLARLIASRLDHDVLVVCGPSERCDAQEILRCADHDRVFSMADQPLDLGTSKACIRRTRLMVSTDSGPRHVAAALGKPVITLRGPTLPIWSENPTVRAVDLRLDLECTGCRERVCPLKHHKCMRDLTAGMVYPEVVRLLQSEESSKAA